MMKFRNLQQNLRRHLWREMKAGQLTGMQLAGAIGYKQAHISNFLNGKRGLSLEGMDLVLSARRLSVLDLLDRDEVNKRATLLPNGDAGFESVPVVDGRTAGSAPAIMRMHMKAALKYPAKFLQKLSPAREGERDGWERFVALRVEAHEGMAMFPRLLPGATVLIDRHYNSLKPYRRDELNMYAVRKDDGNCAIRYVEVARNTLVLRPHNHAYPVEVVAMAKARSASEYIVGRVCHIGIET
jgi:hypothetical protein